jgi:tetratricopeptide (TPR) repeat protein
MKLERRIQTGCILLVMSLGVPLQVSAASFQRTSLERHEAYDSARDAQGLQSLTSASPATQDERYQKALAHFRAGNPKRAIQELRSLHSAVASNALGIVLESMGNRTGALKAFEDALTLQPGFAEPAYNAAKLMIQAGRPKAAIYQLQSALARHPRPVDTTISLRLLLAETDAYVGQDKRAAQLLEALAVERPDSPEVHFNLALTYARLGALDPAIRQFRDELRLNPKDCAGLLGIAKAMLNQKKGPAALPFLQKYVRLRPNDPEGHYVLGYALLDVGRPQEAIANLSKAARISPDDYNIRFHLGLALWQTGKLKAALSQFEAAERLKPDEAQVRFELARILWSQGKKKEAEAESASAERLSALRQRRDQASYCIAKGNLLLDRGDLTGAAEQFRDALELNPKSAGALYNLGLILARSGDQQGARHEFQAAIALDPKLALAYNALGISYKTDGQVSEAKAAFQQAIRINPEYAEAKNNLGTLYATLGQNAEALALFKQATEDSPQYPAPYLNRGLLLAKEGNLNRARAMFENALRLSPGSAEARKDLQIVEEALTSQH